MFNPGLHVLRAVATAAVVTLHCLQPFFHKDRAAAGAFEEMARQGLDFAAPSFFFIAGFLLPRQPRSGLGRRLRRILVPYGVVTVLRWALNVAYERLRRAWWETLLFNLRLTNMSAHWSPDCLLHEKLGALEHKFQHDRSPPGAPRLLFELATGTGFGHFYFVVVLVQLHVLAAALGGVGDRGVSRLALALTVVHPLRGLAFDARARRSHETSAFARDGALRRRSWAARSRRSTSSCACRSCGRASSSWASSAATSPSASSPRRRSRSVTSTPLWLIFGRVECSF